MGPSEAEAGPTAAFTYRIAPSYHAGGLGLASACHPVSPPGDAGDGERSETEDEAGKPRQALARSPGPRRRRNTWANRRTTVHPTQLLVAEVRSVCDRVGRGSRVLGACVLPFGCLVPALAGWRDHPMSADNVPGDLDVGFDEESDFAESADVESAAERRGLSGSVASKAMPPLWGWSLPAGRDPHVHVKATLKLFWSSVSGWSRTLRSSSARMSCPSQIPGSSSGALPRTRKGAEFAYANWMSSTDFGGSFISTRVSSQGGLRGPSLSGTRCLVRHG